MDYMHIYLHIRVSSKMKKRLEMCRNVLCNLIRKNHFVLNEMSANPIEYDALNPPPNDRQFLPKVKYVFEDPDTDIDVHEEENSSSSDQEHRLNTCMKLQITYEGIHITLANFQNVQPLMVSQIIKELKNILKYQKPFIVFFDNNIYLYRNKMKTRFYVALHALKDEKPHSLKKLYHRIKHLGDTFQLYDDVPRRSIHASAVYTEEDLEPLLKKYKLNVNKNKWPNINRLADSHVNRPLFNEEYPAHAYISCLFVKTRKMITCIPF